MNLSQNFPVSPRRPGERVGEGADECVSTLPTSPAGWVPPSAS